MEQGLAHLLDGKASTAEAVNVAMQLAALRLPQAGQGTTAQAVQAAQATRPSPISETLLNHPVIVSLKSPDRRLSYLPARQFATAQGDFATVLALVMAGGMALSGVLYADLGDRAYAAMALAAALGGVFVLLARGWISQPAR